MPVVITEGKTDWKHIKAAFHYFVSQTGKFENLKFKLMAYENELKMGDDKLLKFCLHQSKPIVKHKNKIICLFDRDKPSMIKEVTSIDNRFKTWGNNIFSLVIPVPAFRTFNTISIEQLYKDEDILKLDNNKRRLFLSTEFNPETGEHMKDNMIILNKRLLAKSPDPKIIDHSVSKDGKSIALTKNAFAESVLNQIEPFDQMDFSGFEQLFEHIQIISSLP